MPIFDLEASHREPDTEVTSVSGAHARIPGFTAGIGLFPVFSNNAVMAEVTYCLWGAEFDSEVDYEALTFTGTTTFGMSYFDVHAGYGRYFLDGPWRIYPFAFLGVQFERVRARADFEGEDPISSESRFINYTGTAGFGFFREVATGGIGAELRVKSALLTSEYRFKDPWGEADFELTHPVSVFLVATFLLGHL